uniref:Ubiquitin-like protease family profile domain-containing protein n=1 Tax=Solanum lycopersicum TaxID=4081 RepID=A0A3Q7IGD1_SOLLC
MSSYFPEKITVPKSHLRALFLAKKFIDDDSAVSLVVLYFINDFLFSYEDNEYQISNRDFYLVESGKFNSYSWGLDVYKKLSDSVRHELKSTHKYYRIGGLPLALQIWIFECCSKVDEDIAIRVADSIPRILNWKTIAESPWLKYIEKCLFMPTKNKFENIVASEDEVSKLRLPETRDYHVEILKLEPKGLNHGLDILTNEVIELRKELVNENNKALEEKIDLGFNQIKEFVVNSIKQLLEDISLLFAKSGGSSSVIREVKEPSKKHAGETFSGGLDFNGDEDVAEIAIEKVLSEVVADINVQEAADVNTVGAKPDDATEDCQKSLHTFDDFILLDKDLSQINRTEESYLKKRAQVDQTKRNGGDDESDLIDSFTKWLYTGTKKRGKKPYTDALNVINPAFELGVCTVDERLWFFKLAHSGQQWCDEHIDVIFYYLINKGKYETNSNVRFTTTDCVFKTKITNSFFKLCDAHEDKKNFKVLDSDDITRYISGRRLLASTSWDKVDFVLIPLNIKENRHWIFVVFDIGQRSLEVYDSFPARGGVNLEN